MSFPHKTFPIDNSAILYLAQLRNNHSNTYRFTIALSEPVCPQTLQQAADRVCPRFPTIIAGFRPDFFSYTVVPAEKAPTVQKDPGLLRTMRMEEIRRCAYRIFYSGSEIHIEAFHALTDGYGAILSFRTRVAEYLRIRYGLQSPEQTEMLEGGRTQLAGRAARRLSRPPARPSRLGARTFFVPAAGKGSGLVGQNGVPAV